MNRNTTWSSIVQSASIVHTRNKPIPSCDWFHIHWLFNYTNLWYDETNLIVIEMAARCAWDRLEKCQTRSYRALYQILMDEGILINALFRHQYVLNPFIRTMIISIHHHHRLLYNRHDQWNKITSTTHGVGVEFLVSFRPHDSHPQYLCAAFRRPDWPRPLIFHHLNPYLHTNTYLSIDIRHVPSVPIDIEISDLHHDCIVPTAGRHKHLKRRRDTKRHAKATHRLPRTVHHRNTDDDFFYYEEES